MSNGHANIKSICPVCELEFPEGTPVSWAPTGIYKGLKLHSQCMISWQGKGAPRFDQSILDKVHQFRVPIYRQRGWDEPKPWPLSKTTRYPGIPDVAVDKWKNPPVDIDPIPVVSGSPNGIPVAKPESDNPITQAILDALWPVIEAHVTKPTVDMEQVEALIAERLKDIQSPEPRSIKFEVVDLPAITSDTPHPLLPKLVQLLTLGLIPYLHNGAGSGKTHGALEALKIMACTTAYLTSCNPFSSPIELTGYTDALSKFVDKPLTLALRKAMAGERVGLVLDEADAARPDFLPTLNGILAQKMMTLSNGETLTLPDTFFLILTGNTNMKGATRGYNARNAQDESVQDRLWFMKWDYDEALEIQICNEQYGARGVRFAQYCQSIRHYVQNDSTISNVNVTLRGMLNGLKVLTNPGNLFSIDEATEAEFFKHCARDTRSRVLAACPLPEAI